jgi:serine phosphatase RsbU (regulator of sigma subunit)
MAKLSADVRFCMLTEPNLAAAVTQLNSLVCQAAIPTRFVTLVAAVVDAVNHTVTVVNAGHPRPLIYRRETSSVEEIVSDRGAEFPLGVIDNYEYGSCEISLKPGESILAFTDGVTDAMDIQGGQLETAGLYAAIQGASYSPRALGEKVVNVVKQFTAGRAQIDDIALVAFGRKP